MATSRSRPRALLLLLLLPVAAAWRPLAPMRAPPLRHRAACCAVPGDDIAADAAADDDLSLGALLAEIASRQQAELPDDELLELMEGSIDAMLTSGAAELDEAAAALNSTLDSLQENVTSMLQDELYSEAQLEKARRIEAVARRLQMDMVWPARSRIAQERSALNVTATEYAELRNADTGRLGSRPRKASAVSPLPSGGSSGLVRAAELSASLLGLLLLLGALSTVGGLRSVVGDEAADALVLAWRAGFGLSLCAYVGSLVLVMQRQRGRGGDDT